MINNWNNKTIQFLWTVNSPNGKAEWKSQRNAKLFFYKNQLKMGHCKSETVNCLYHYITNSKINSILWSIKKNGQRIYMKWKSIFLCKYFKWQHHQSLKAHAHFGCKTKHFNVIQRENSTTTTTKKMKKNITNKCSKCILIILSATKVH